MMSTLGFKETEYLLSYVSVAPLLTNIISAVFCLGCSAAFHLYSVKSKLAQDVLSRLDYGGISVLIFGSSVPIVIYGFACDGASFTKWTSFFVALTLDLACVVVTFIKKFDQSKYRPVRGIMFMLAGLATIAFFFLLHHNTTQDKIPVSA